MVSFSSSFNFRNDNRHLVFVEIFSFIPTAPSLMGHVRVSRDKESVIQVMQDGDFYRFFFQTIIAGNFSFGQVTCRQPNVYTQGIRTAFFPKLLAWDFWKQNCKVCFYFLLMLFYSIILRSTTLQSARSGKFP